VRSQFSRGYGIAMLDRANYAKTIAGRKVAESVAERHGNQIGADGPSLNPATTSRAAGLAHW
jgi:hypothetical protein